MEKFPDELENNESLGETIPDEVLDRVDELRRKKYTDEEIIHNMEVDEGRDPKQVEGAMRKLDEEEREKEAEWEGLSEEEKQRRLNEARAEDIDLPNE